MPVAAGGEGGATSSPLVSEPIIQGALLLDDHFAASRLIPAESCSAIRAWSAPSAPQ